MKTSKTTLALSLIFGAAVLAGCQGGHGNYTEAHYSAAKLKMDALKSGTEFQMAQQAFLAGDLKKAEKHVNYSIDLNPNVARSHVLRGRVMMEKGNLEEANRSFQQAEGIAQDNVDAQYFQGLLAERLMRPEQALIRYQKAAELDQSNSQYPVAAAEMLILLNRAAEAETYLNGCKDRFDHSPGIRQTMGQLCVLRGDSVQAEQFFFEASLLAPNDQQIMEDLIQAQMANHKFAEADSLLSRLMSQEENKTRRDLMHARAVCLVQTERLGDARQLFLKLTEGDDGAADYDAWLGLARLSVTLRDSARLREASNRLVSIDPKRQEGFVLRAIQQRKSGDIDGAYESLTKALAIRQDPETLVLLGLVERDAGHSEGARAAFAKAVELDPGNQTAAQLLGATTAQAGAGTDQ